MAEQTLEKVTLPETSEATDESLIVLWYKSEGDRVEEGEALVEIQTEKTTFEIEATASGTLKEICVKRGESATVGDVLAIISQAGSQSIQEVGPKRETQQQLKPERSDSFVPASPRVRRLAKQLGVDLQNVEGTGANGRLTEDDVKAAAEVAKQKKTVTSGVRRTIAKRMMESLHGAAQLTETAWADVTTLVENKQRWRAKAGWTDWILRSSVLSLQEHPMLNATWHETEIEIHDHVNLGVATDTEKGLLVPVLKQAERLTLPELHTSVKTITRNAREGHVSRHDLTGGTFTVTSLGSYGIQFFTPIINPPESAILGVGQIEEHLVMENGQPSERYRIPLSLTFDHRIVDGAPAARFLQSLIQRLEHPEEIMQEIIPEM